MIFLLMYLHDRESREVEINISKRKMKTVDRTIVQGMICILASLVVASNFNSGIGYRNVQSWTIIRKTYRKKNKKQYAVRKIRYKINRKRGKKREMFDRLILQLDNPWRIIEF